LWQLIDGEVEAKQVQQDTPRSFKKMPTIDLIKSPKNIYTFLWIKQALQKQKYI